MTHFLGLITTIKAKTIWMRRVTEAPINRCASRHSVTSPWPTTGTVLRMQQESLIKVRRCRAIGVVRTSGRALPRGSQRLREVKCDLPAGERQHLQPCGSTARLHHSTLLNNSAANVRRLICLRGAFMSCSLFSLLVQFFLFTGMNTVIALAQRPQGESLCLSRSVEHVSN